jgi:anti-sigma factor RsiW
MNVTREIVKDLLPLYVAGEVSADSRAAVEAVLGEDADLARLADALRRGEPALSRVVPPPSPDRAALDRTKAMLRRRTWLLAFAWLFSGLPLSFVFDSGGFRFLLIRDAPVAASLCLTVAVVLWTAFAVTARRLRVTGL